MEFLTGIHQAAFLFGTRRTPPHGADFPVFPSFSTLSKVATLKPAVAPWAMDSGGFTQLQQHGRWTFDEHHYIQGCRAITTTVGARFKPKWLAPMDWMNEDIVREGGRLGPVEFAGTGLTITQHHERTIDNALTLARLAPDLPFIKVIQGPRPADYVRHIAMYREAGIDLAAEPLVGVGGVCRIQDTPMVAEIFTAIVGEGVRRLHGFGVKSEGIWLILKALAEIGHMDALVSTDSLAWSYNARRNPPLPGCRHGKTGTGNCANCLVYARAWRQKLCADIDTWTRQLTTQPLQLALGAQEAAA